MYISAFILTEYVGDDGLISIVFNKYKEKFLNKFGGCNLS